MSGILEVLFFKSRIRQATKAINQSKSGNGHRSGRCYRINPRITGVVLAMPVQNDYCVMTLSCHRQIITACHMFIRRLN